MVSKPKPTVDRRAAEIGRLVDNPVNQNVFPSTKKKVAWSVGGSRAKLSSMIADSRKKNH